MSSINPNMSSPEDEIARQLKELEDSDAATLAVVDTNLAVVDTKLVVIRESEAESQKSLAVMDSTIAAVAEPANNSIPIPPEDAQLLLQKIGEEDKGELFIADAEHHGHIDLSKFNIAGIRNKISEIAHLFDGSRAHARMQEGHSHRVFHMNGEECIIREWGPSISSKHVQQYVEAFQVNRLAIQLMRDRNKQAAEQSNDEAHAKAERELKKHHIAPLKAEKTSQDKVKPDLKDINPTGKSQQRKMAELQSEIIASIIKQNQLDRKKEKDDKIILKKEEAKSEAQQETELKNGIIAQEQHSWRSINVNPGEVETVNVFTKQAIASYRRV